MAVAIASQTRCAACGTLWLRLPWSCWGQSSTTSWYLSTQRSIEKLVGNLSILICFSYFSSSLIEFPGNVLSDNWCFDSTVFSFEFHGNSSSFLMLSMRTDERGISEERSKGNEATWAKTFFQNLWRPLRKKLQAAVMKTRNHPGIGKSFSFKIRVLQNPVHSLTAASSGHVTESQLQGVGGHDVTGAHRELGISPIQTWNTTRICTLITTSNDVLTVCFSSGSPTSIDNQNCVVASFCCKFKIILTLCDFLLSTCSFTTGRSHSNEPSIEHCRHQSSIANGISYFSGVPQMSVPIMCGTSPETGQTSCDTKSGKQLRIKLTKTCVHFEAWHQHRTCKNGSTIIRLHYHN